MQTHDLEEKGHHRGPLPPWPADCGLLEWLEMSSERRAEHFKRHADSERPYHDDEAKLERDTARMIAYWDHLAGLVAMDKTARAEQIRRDVEATWSDLRRVSGEKAAEAEMARQTKRAIAFWNQVAADSMLRRAGGA
jgi:hypothetical protein